VLRGPSSVLYGDTSTAGLLNLVSKRPQAETHREIGIQYGSFDRKQIQTDMTGKLTEDGQWLYRFIGIFRDSNYQTDFVKDDRIVIAPSVTWRPTTATNWTLLGTYQKDTSGSSTAFLPIEGTLYPGPNGRIPVNRFVGAPGFDKYQTTSGSVSSLFEHAFNNAFTLRQNTRYTHTNGIYNTMYPEQYFNDGTNPNYPFLDATRRTVARIVSARDTTKDALTSDTNAELKLQTGPVSHRLLAGLDYRRLDDRARSGAYVDTTPFDLYAPIYTGVAAPTLSAEPDSLQSQSGLYLQDQLRLGPWIAVLGVRQDWVTSDVQGSPVQNDKATTWRAGLMYELPFGMTPYVSYAQSFNPIFGSGVCATLCQPMRGEQVEVGFKYQPFKGLVVNAALYDVTEKNRLASDPANPLYSIQTGEVRIQGAELEVLTSATRDLDIIGSYAYTDARVQSGDNAGNHVETVPLHQASLWAKYRLDGLGLRGFTVGAGARYVGETWDGAEHFKTPDYTLFDAMLRYETGPWRWQINASNLADKQHVTTCLARGDCFYGAGRTILTSLTYKF
jgi:iron complex outermembrane recepter protein